MSSNSYQDKSMEELRPIVDNYITNYAKLFGESSNIAQVAEKLKKLRIEKELALFNSMFGHLTPKNLSDCIKIIEELNSSIKSKASKDASIKAKRKSISENDSQLEEK